MRQRTRARLAIGILLTLTLTACAATRPPNLTPQANIAFTNTRVQQALDLIRDTVDDGSKTVPPVFSGAVDVCVATWHEEAITILHAGPGWQTKVTAGLDALPTRCVLPNQQTIAPYVALAKTLITQVTP